MTMSGGMPWVKVYTEMLDDPKLAKIDEAIKWRFIELILVAAECDAGGAFIVGDSEMTIDDIAWRLREDKIKLSSDIELLIKAGILHKDGTVLEIPKFADRQGPTQKEKRASWKERQQKRRERVTRDSQNPADNSHALEKSREEKNRVDEVPEQRGDFALFNDTFQAKTRMTNYTPIVAIKAFEQITTAGATINDMVKAIEEMAKKGYAISSPASIVNPTINCMNFRLAHQSKETPKQPKQPKHEVLKDGNGDYLRDESGRVLYSEVPAC